MNRGEFNRWLRHQVFPEDESERAIRIVLCAVTAGKKIGDEIVTIPVPKKGPEDEWFQARIEEIESSAKSDATGLAVPLQTYAVLSYFEKGENAKPRSRFTFRELGTSDDESDDLATEPPTKLGSLSQQMRHNEQLAKINADMTTKTIGHLQQTIAQLSESHQKLVDDRLGTIELVEKLRSEQFERQLAYDREKTDSEQKRMLLEKLMVLAPVVVQKITGKALPGVKSDKENVLDSLIESFSPEQMNSLQAILTPDQLIAVVSLIEARKKEEEERETRSPLREVK